MTITPMDLNLTLTFLRTSPPETRYLHETETPGISARFGGLRPPGYLHETETWDLRVFHALMNPGDMCVERPERRSREPAPGVTPGLSACFHNPRVICMPWRGKLHPRDIRVDLGEPPGYVHYFR